MDQCAITPTITHRVRTFLRGQGAAVAPWSGLDETYTELYSLLRRRREDERIWEPLTELLLTATPEEVAAALQEMRECCVADTTPLAGDLASSRDAHLSGTLCYVALPYRRVAFPEA